MVLNEAIRINFKGENKMDDIDDLKRDSLIDKKMREDLEYAIERTDFVKAIVMLENVKKALAGYGHEYTLKELVEMW